LIFKDFRIFIRVIRVLPKSIELLRVLPAKIVPSGSGGSGGIFFQKNPKNPKDFHKMLDFQGFELLG